MKLTLKQIRDAMERTDSKKEVANNYYPFWNLDYGQSVTLRFLPDKNENNNPLGFIVEKHMHNLEVNGEWKKIPCLDQEGGKTCPICKQSRDYYNSGDKENGKKLWRKKQYIAQCLIIDDQMEYKDDEEIAVGKVKYLSMSFQLFQILKEAFESGDLEETPYAYKGGIDFRIKKSKQGQYANYTAGTGFVRKQSKLTDEQIKYVESEIVDLATLLPEKLKVSTVQGMLDAYLNHEEYLETGKAPVNSDEEVVKSVEADEAPD